jgi:LL-diaminopimelate aminotransferase
MEIKRSQRLDRLPPYLFTELDRMKQEIVSRGKDVISLGIGDPDLPPARPVIEALKSAVEDPSVHMYPPNPGTLQLRQAVARWHERGFGVKLDPQKEVLVLVGTKEGICHLPLALVNPGDTVLVPEPGYPPYRSGTVFAGGEVHELPLKAGGGVQKDQAPVHKLSQ